MSQSLSYKQRLILVVTVMTTIIVVNGLVVRQALQPVMTSHFIDGHIQWAHNTWVEKAQTFLIMEGLVIVFLSILFALMALCACVYDWINAGRKDTTSSDDFDDDEISPEYLQLGNPGEDC